MDQDEFYNILKDCWVGRKYKCPEVIWIIEIVGDEGDRIHYCITSEDNSIPVSGSTAKIYFREYLIRHSFVRVRN